MLKFPLIGDLETTVKNIGEGSIGGMKSSPFWRDNYIVAHGLKLGEERTKTWWMESPDYTKILNRTEVLVAHNMQFDLKYWLRFHGDAFTPWLAQGGRLWCTMLAEYLLSGMTSQFPSLNDTCVKYGGELKDESIKEYWDSGVGTEDIPYEQLLPYLETDVENTYKIYLGQVEKAKQLGMYELLLMHMESLIAIIVMEYNGLKFDLEYARKEIKRLTAEAEETNGSIIEYMKTVFEEPVWHKLSVDSKDQLSVMLFGGEYSYTTQEPILNKDGEPTYYSSKAAKAGEQRFKSVIKTLGTNGLGATPKPTWELKKKGIFCTDEEVLKTVYNECPRTQDFISKVMKGRTINKDLGTYFLGYSKLVFEDGFIHHSLNTVITSTGRLSSSSPNMQNLSGKGD